jgi:hypothetical protein
MWLQGLHRVKEIECIARGHESMMLAHAKAEDNMVETVCSKSKVLLDQSTSMLFSLNELQLKLLDAWEYLQLYMSEKLGKLYRRFIASI